MDIHSELIENIFTFSRLLKEKMSYNSRICHMSMLQLQVLVYLKRNPYTQMTDIAAHFTIELPSATSLITKLKSLGLVERKADTKDRRLVRISLTKKGDSLLSDAMKERSKKITEILKHLPIEDKKSLLSILQKLIIKMEKKNEK